MARETIERMRMAESIRHAGESGRAREQLFREYLGRLVPDEFSIGTGFVIDIHGDISLQQDLVIYRTSYHPRFSVGGVDFFPIEAVAAVVEIKARIDSRNTLTAALINGASVKRLDRSGGGQNYTLRGRDVGELIDRDLHAHQVFTAILAVQGMTPKTTLDVMLAFMADEPARNWLNMFVAVDAFSTAYLPSVPRVDPMGATHLGISPGQTHENTVPLVDFTQMLISFLRVTPIVDFQPSAYIPGSYTSSYTRPVPPRV